MSPYVGGPYDGGHNPDGEIDAIGIRRGGSDESGRYALTGVKACVSSGGSR
ncbi:hypothetical protein [Streptomyces sp. NPDC046759]|uniref:hypothetical protein n=1 Tax=Streptomyces sp. NPDC046759 TaxID=3155019 RepID=UPI0034057EDF